MREEEDIQHIHRHHLPKTIKQKKRMRELLRRTREYDDGDWKNRGVRKKK